MRRRTVNVFGLSFLDVMFCGFGSVILLVMLISGDTVRQRDVVHQDLRGEVTRLERERMAGEHYLGELRQSVADSERERRETLAMAEAVAAEIDTAKRAAATLASRNRTTAEEVASLKAELAALEKERTRLGQVVESQTPRRGDHVRRFVGEGDRQYLTGLRMGGRRVLILVDVSASMLDETIVNIVRRRNMPEAEKRKSKKWRRALATVEWLLSQLPPEGRYQLYTFGTEAKPARPNTGGQWLAASDGKGLDEAVDALYATIPAGGTSLAAAFGAIREFRPAPDNVMLLTDGLPTQGAGRPRKGKVSGRERLGHFGRAVAKLPRGVPINTILFPMEGDPMAASAFWKLAGATDGSFIVPSKDWP